MQAALATFREITVWAASYPHSVRDIQLIRLQNLGFLLEECEAELGRQRGAASLLATRTGVRKSLISMLCSGTLNAGSGKQRQIGDDTATRLEEGMAKPKGWLDEDRSEAQDFKEAAHLDLLRTLSPSQREAVERMMKELADAAPTHSAASTA